MDSDDKSDEPGGRSTWCPSLAEGQRGTKNSSPIDTEEWHWEYRPMERPLPRAAKSPPPTGSVQPHSRANRSASRNACSTRLRASASTKTATSAGSRAQPWRASGPSTVWGRTGRSIQRPNWRSHNERWKSWRRRRCSRKWASAMRKRTRRLPPSSPRAAWGSTLRWMPLPAVR